MVVMVLFERDKPKLILLWSVIFLLTQLVGYIVYLLIRKVYFEKKKCLETKKKEDEVYLNLISNKIKNNKINCANEVLNFSSLAFASNTTQNNAYEFFNKYEKAKSELIKDLKSAQKYILLELTKINAKDFEEIKEVLMEKAKAGVVVKLIHDRYISKKVKKSLKLAGAKVYRFSKLNVCNSAYENLRNIISIDGKFMWLGDFYINKKQLSGEFDIANAIIRIQGDVVQEIDLNLHQDVVFASGKFLNFTMHEHLLKNENVVQYVANQVDTEIELLIIKAICTAKKSIQLQLNKFIPTESIMSLLKFAINSNIDVRLMIPLKSNRHGKYYASRAYAKELALAGANVYLYDGYIRFNAITIDSEYVLSGSFTLDREYIGSSLQNVILFNDRKATEHFNKMFNDGINNSYRINNAKYMLIQEKFFRNFE